MSWNLAHILQQYDALELVIIDCSCEMCVAKKYIAEIRI